MKKILLVLVLLATLPLFGQRNASNWGDRILFGPTFEKTDSIKVRKTSLRDTVLADTMYSGVLDIDDWIDGIYTVRPFFTNIGGGSDSLVLEVRLVTKYKDKNTRVNTYKFGPWKSLFTSMVAATYYSLGIAQSDSSWWQPASGRQYRLYDTSVTIDSTTHLITDFLR